MVPPDGARVKLYSCAPTLAATILAASCADG